MQPMAGIQVVTLALNFPGPLGVAKLRQMGAAIVKVEPPEGDPLHHAFPDWYQTLHEGIEIVSLNLKRVEDRDRLGKILERAALLVTASRPAALERLGLSWPMIHAKYPKLWQVGVVGYSSPEDNLPGHDLNYQARLGLLDPPALPRALIADWAGSEALVSAALASMLARERGQSSQYSAISLSNAAAHFAEPLRRGLTAPGGLLGGGLPGYNVYPAKDGWVSVAALEPHFWSRLCEALGLTDPDRQALEQHFRMRTAIEWESWAVEKNLPIAALREAVCNLEKPK